MTISIGLLAIIGGIALLFILFSLAWEYRKDSEVKDEDTQAPDYISQDKEERKLRNLALKEWIDEITEPKPLRDSIKEQTWDEERDFTTIPPLFADERYEDEGGLELWAKAWQELETRLGDD